MSTGILKTNDIHDRIVCRRPCNFCLFAAQRAVGNKVEMEAAQTAVIQTMIPAVLVWQEFSAGENKLTQSIKGIPCKKSRTSCPAFLGRVPLFFGRNSKLDKPLGAHGLLSREQKLLEGVNSS